MITLRQPVDAIIPGQLQHRLPLDCQRPNRSLAVLLPSQRYYGTQFVTHIHLNGEK